MLEMLGTLISIGIGAVLGVIVMCVLSSGDDEVKENSSGDDYEKDYY